MDLMTWLETQSLLFPGVVWIDLMHMRSTGIVRATRFAMPDKDKSAIASLIMTSAHSACAGSRGPQTFILYLLEENGFEPVCQHPLSVENQARSPEELPSTSEGVLKQVMNHNAMLMRHVNENAEKSYASHNILAAENERLRTRCEVVENKHLEVMALQEEILSMRGEREIAQMRARSSEARKSKLANSLSDLMPMVGPTIAGKLGFEVQQPERDPALGGFLKTITNEQLAKLQGVLRPEQIAALGMLYKKHVIEEDEHKPPPNPQAQGKKPTSDVN